VEIQGRGMLTLVGGLCFVRFITAIDVALSIIPVWRRDRIPPPHPSES
jgi:hypothetical protein